MLVRVSLCKLVSVAFCLLLAAGTSGVAVADTEISAAYRGDILYNASGGLETGSAYLDNADFTIAMTPDALLGADDARFFVHLLYNNGATFSDTYSGDLQVVSNIDALHGIRVFEFWYEQNWSDKFSLRFGLYDLNSEFDAIATAGLFMNSSHGIGADFSQSGEGAPSIFPVTSLAARFSWQPDSQSTLRFAILDGVPGDPDDPGKTSIELSSDDGVLTVLEYNYVGGGDVRLAVGGWLYSAKFDKLGAQDPQGNPGQENANSGVYAFVDSPLFAASNGMVVNGFLRYGVANDAINVLDSYFGGGIVATGAFAARPDDQLGLAFGNAHAGGPFKRVVNSAGARVASAETSIELTYSAQVQDWLRLQPNIQYVVGPGLNPALKNALVFTLQFEITAGRVWN